MTKDEAQPEQEPVAWIGYDEVGVKTYTASKWIAESYPELYTIPLYPHSQRPWVDLTPQDLNEIFAIARTGEDAVRLALDKLKEKNT